MNWIEWLSSVAETRRPPAAKAAIAAAILVVSVTARFALADWMNQTTFMIFVPGIVLGALFCGLWYGAALVLLFGLVTYYAIMPPAFSFTLADNTSIVQLALFLPIGGLIVILVAGLLELTRRLRTETETKEALFRELQHRVANNLQVVSLSLQDARRKIVDPAAVQAIDQTIARVTTLAQLHRRLYDSATYQAGLEPILRDLLPGVFHGLPVEVRLSVEALNLPVNQMTAVLLLVNEAAVNAAKHVFREGHGSWFEVALRELGDGRIQLKIRDDGPGFPAEPSKHARPGYGLGMKVMQGFARQLGGVLNVEPGPGASLTVEFPKVQGQFDA